jgi:hypothetical protein
MAILASFESQMAGFDPAVAVPEDVSELVRTLHASRRQLVAYEDLLTEAAERHAAAGTAPPVEETLTGDGDTSRATARSARRRRHAAGQLHDLGHSLRNGNAKSENVDAIARALAKLTDPVHRAALVGFDARLTSLAETLPPSEFVQRLDGFVRRAMADNGLSLFEKQRQRSRLSIWQDKDGMTRVDGTLDPEWGGAMAKSLDSEMRSLVQAYKNDTTRTEPVQFDDRLRAEALAELLARSSRPDAKLALPQVSIIMNHDRTVAEFADGAHVCPETAARLCCDAVIRDIVMDRTGLPLAVGRRRRTATDAQRVALRAVYRNCAWPSCDRPFDHCQIHHVVPWEHGGPTDLDNLLPLCSHHHHLAHEGLWRLKLEVDRTLWIWRPDGRHHATAPPSGLHAPTPDEPPLPSPGSSPPLSLRRRSDN